MKLKKGLAVLTSLVTLAAVNSFSTYRKPEKVSAAGAVLAFPGAVGGGKYATGGRGGEVVHVTNLNDSGEGSFRDAVSKPNRIVVFDVSGTIELKGNIIVLNNTTIAGQTAPGGSGITLKNYKLGMGGDNIICRYISSRPGPYASTSSGNDAWGGAKGANSIIDHCSMGWTTDEQWGLYSNNEYYTVQYSVIGPADSWGGHKKGLHGFGIMMGNGYLTFDHNLIIHNVSRNFRGKVPGTKTADFTNNVIYDWGYQTAYGTIGHLNYVKNTLKAGNSTTGGYHWMNVDSTTSPQNFKVYCDGNRMINKDGSINGITYNNWNGVTVKSGIGITKDNLYSASSFQTIVNGENVSTAMTAESAEASYDHVINYAGNGIAPNKRTAIDQQCAAETKNGTGSCSGTSAYDASVSDLNKYSIKCGVTYSYPAPVLKKTITDTDNDGMPDEWETARGLDPNDPSDTNDDYCGQGYTNIEYYLNDLTVDSFPPGVVKTSPLGSSTTPVPVKSAFETIEAENFDSQEGVKTEDLESGGQNIGFIENGDYTAYRKVDFEDGARSFKAVISGNAAGIELYLDSLGGSPAAKLEFKGTGGFSDYKEAEFNIPLIKGRHTLYLKFTGGDGYLVNLDSFIFGKDPIPVNGKLIRNLLVKDETYMSKWQLAENAGKGSLIFGDRDFTFTEFPEEIDGAEMILTPCDAKNLSASELASFTAGKNIKAYIALDSRVEKVPDWMEGFTKTAMTCKSSNDVTFDLYEKEIPAGEKVVLGSNGQSYMCVNYAVFAVQYGEDITEPPVTETTEPATSAEPVKPVGDINIDGKTDLADAVLLQEYLVCAAELTEEQGEQADINKDEILNVFDLMLLKKIIM